MAGVDPEPFEDPEISGIAGTSLGAVFSYEVARSLARRHGRAIDIAWDRYDEVDRIGPLAARLVPLSREDWPVEAHVPFQRWIAAAHPRRTSDLAWLLDRLPDWQAGVPPQFEHQYAADVAYPPGGERNFTCGQRKHAAPTRKHCDILVASLRVGDGASHYSGLRRK